LSIEKSAFDSNVVAIPKCPETILICSLSVGRKRHDHPLSGLIADFEGSALEIHLLHPSIERLESEPWTVIPAPTLIAILD
jgi:hypothetical protein